MGLFRSANSPGKLQVRFIDGHLFNLRSRFANDAHYLAGFIPIKLHSRWNENSVRTEPPGRRAWHRGTHPKLARFIARRADHPAAFRRASHDHRLSFERGILALLDRS